VAADSFSRGDMLYKELVIAEWWLLAFIPAGSLLLAIEFLRRLWRAWRAPDKIGRDTVTEGF
jgi:hypothetical protein